MTRAGWIVGSADHGSVWEVRYRARDGIHRVTFDHRPFAAFYEAATGRSFVDDYRFGSGAADISKALKGRRVCVDGPPFHEIVRLEGDGQ